MKAVVVYESLYGNTRAVAEAIAQGLGEGAVALSTADATADALAAADLVIAGAPAHIRNLPTSKSRTTAVERFERGEAPNPDLSHPPMREWLASLQRGAGASAAFETRVAGRWGGGAVGRIERGLRRARYRRLVKGEGFIVDRGEHGPVLHDGELERARAWGAEIGRAT